MPGPGVTLGARHLGCGRQGLLLLRIGWGFSLVAQVLVIEHQLGGVGHAVDVELTVQVVEFMLKHGWRGSR